MSELSAVLAGAAMGSAGAVVAALLIVGPSAAPIVREPVHIPTKMIELDCSGDPHINRRGDSLIFAGWSGDRKVTVYNGERRDDVNITGLLCSVSIVEDR